jgi:hypothetical protein
MKKFFTIIIVVFVLITISFCGCGNKSNLISVSGNITFDGQPLPDGTIAFIPAGAIGSPTAAKIKNGKYNARVSAGSMIVRITAEKNYAENEIKELKEDPMHKSDPLFKPENFKKQYIPKIYNELSILKEEINDSAKNIDFNLKSTGE